MEEVNNKYDRFVKRLEDIIQDKHAHFIEPLYKLSAVDLISLIHKEVDMETAKDNLTNALGLTEDIIAEYKTEDVELIQKYLEYFYEVSKKFKW